MSEESLLPVTALEFCVVSGSELLLAGEGPKLKLFNVSKSGNLAQTQSEVLPFGKIHGIRPGNGKCNALHVYFSMYCNSSFEC